MTFVTYNNIIIVGSVLCTHMHIVLSVNALDALIHVVFINKNIERYEYANSRGIIISSILFVNAFTFFNKQKHAR